MDQSPCGRRVNPDVCELKHQQWEQLCIEREKRFLEKIDSVMKTAEAKSESDAQAIVIKARADLVTEARMKEYFNTCCKRISFPAGHKSHLNSAFIRGHGEGGFGPLDKG